jgi:ubiquinone/menaquinone biosynthesis C-methylase UbiE
MMPLRHRRTSAPPHLRTQFIATLSSLLCLAVAESCGTGLRAGRPCASTAAAQRPVASHHSSARLPAHRRSIAQAAPDRNRTPSRKSDRATATHSFADVEQWSKVFDDPRRDSWQRPKELVAALALQPGQTVADLGAGTGYFSGYLAAAVGADGTVLAVDVEPTLVEHLRRRAEQGGHTTVVPVLASLDNPRLPRRGVDLIFIADTFHHFDHRSSYLPYLRRALRPGGRVAVIDWKPGELPEGPPPDHKLAREQVVEEMRAAGFVLADDIDVLPYQYVLVFRAADS